MIAEPIPFSPASERNKTPILEVLATVLPRAGVVLEIGSGTGQHVVHFASHLSRLQWQPADRAEYLPDLRRRLAMEGSGNVRDAIELDVLNDWPEEIFDAIYSANTAHIMSWPAVCAMFAGVARHLVEGGVFCLYGPFNEGGHFTAPSNEAFDARLRRENPAMGLRDIDALETLAQSHQLQLARRFPMPANNQILLFTLYGGPPNLSRST